MGIKEAIDVVKQYLGIEGSPSSRALKAIILEKSVDYSIYNDIKKFKGWHLHNVVAAFLQIVSKKHGIDAGPVDGYFGHNTANAAEELKYFLDTRQKMPNWRTDEVSIKTAVGRKFPKADQKSLIDFYGQPKQNQVLVDVPYPMVLAWDKSTTITRFTCHKKVAESIKRVYKRVLDHYGYEKIKELGLDIFGGCYMYRRKRGGSTLSTHAWAIAIDTDPERNRLRWGRDKAQLAKPEYNYWWYCWEEEGWTSLGKEKNYDWMHVQAASL